MPEAAPRPEPFTPQTGPPMRGGHFAPFEEPELHAHELREPFRPTRAAV